MKALNTTLVLGGARSGKSSFAESLVRDSGLTPFYVATATAGDDEMRLRIDRHRTERGKNWTTIEEPLALVETLSRQPLPAGAVVVDCLTLWLSNIFMSKLDVEQETKKLTELLSRKDTGVVLVSNEVGLGIVPDTPLGRSFRDAQGRLNQAVAGVVPNVVLVAAGLPLWLKR